MGTVTSSERSEVNLFELLQLLFENLLPGFENCRFGSGFHVELLDSGANLVKLLVDGNKGGESSIFEIFDFLLD